MDTGPLCALDLLAPEYRGELSDQNITFGSLFGNGILLYGSSGSGKSSLAFQCALNCAAGHAPSIASPTRDLDNVGQVHPRVVVCCHRSVPHTKAPKPQSSMDALDEETLDRIEFVYVETLADVRRHCAELFDFTTESQRASGSPAKMPPPTLIVVEDDGLSDAAISIGGNSSIDAKLSYSKTVALLESTTSYIRTQGDQWPGLRLHAASYILVSNIAASIGLAAVSELPFSPISVLGEVMPCAAASSFFDFPGVVGPNHYRVHLQQRLPTLQPSLRQLRDGASLVPQCGYWFGYRLDADQLTPVTPLQEVQLKPTDATAARQGDTAHW